MHATEPGRYTKALKEIHRDASEGENEQRIYIAKFLLDEDRTVVGFCVYVKVISLIFIFQLNNWNN